MAGESCYNCVYAYWDLAEAMQALSRGFPSRPGCANHPESLGRMTPVTLGQVCRNYREKPATPEGDVKRIPLGDGFYAYVSAEDYGWLSKHHWRLHNGYAARWKKDKRVYMHREIMNPAAGRLVDHKNHNKLDNSRPNLRDCSPEENQRNQRKQHGTVSMYKGVSFWKAGGKWRATIRFHRRNITLGCFDTEIEAARAYDRAAVELFREFAGLNFPEEWPPERREQLYADLARPRRARKPKAGKSTRKGEKK